MDHRQGAPSQQRRVFRGRSGPTDGRLPPKRKKAPAVRHNGTKYDDSSNSGRNSSQSFHREADHDNKLAPFPQTEPVSLNDDIASEPSPITSHSPPIEEEEAATFQTELQHLKKRTANHRLSMSQSSSCSLENYSANVLNAAMKIIREWGSIYRFHHQQEQESSNHEFLAVVHPMATLIFELLQQCLQTGPLAGAKPGYFKRCGSEVAQTVSTFLENLNDDIPGLSENQYTMLRKWKSNADKAAAKETLPSKSMLKRINKKGSSR